MPIIHDHHVTTKTFDRAGRDGSIQFNWRALEDSPAIWRRARL
jgi:hypothetical protein